MYSLTKLNFWSTQYPWNLKYDTNEPLYENRSRITDIGNRLVIAKGVEVGWEVGVSRCKLLYVEWINNKVWLYSTENCIQYPKINRNGKESFFFSFFKKNICRMLPDLPWKGLFPWSFPLILSLSYKLICQKCLGPQLRLREYHLWAEHPQPFPTPGTATVNMALALAEVEGLQTWLLRPRPLGTDCLSMHKQTLPGVRGVSPVPADAGHTLPLKLRTDTLLPTAKTPN